MTKIDLDNVKWTILGDDDFIEPQTGPELDTNSNLILLTARPDNEDEAMSEGLGFRPTGDWVEPGEGDFDDNTGGGGSYYWDYRYNGNDEYVELPHKLRGKVLATNRGFFYNMTKSIKAVKSTNKNVTNMSYMFYTFKPSTKNTNKHLDLTRLDVSSVTSMVGMFQDTELESIDISGWDTSNVENFRSFIYSHWSKRRSGRGHIPFDLTLLDTSSATNMGMMFCHVEDDVIDLSSFDTSNVTEMGSMFQGVKANKLNLSGFDTSGSYFQSMFEDAEIPVIDLTSFNTSDSSSFSSMFAGVKANEIILNSFNTDNIHQMLRMFEGAEVPTLDLSSFDLSGKESVRKADMFRNAKIDTIYVRSELEKSIFEESETRLPIRTEIIVGGKGYIPPVSGEPIEKVIEEEQIVKYKTRKIKDREMRDGQTIVDQEGKDGKRINRVKILTYPDGKVEREILSSKIIKHVQDETIRVGTLISEETERDEKVLPHETKYYNDYDARKGERVEQRGEDGYSKKTYTVIKHSDGYVERILEEEDYKEPVTEIIAIGMIERTNRVTKEEIIPHRTFKEYSYNHKQKPDGEPDVIERGKDGVIKRTYEVTTYTDDTPQKWDLIPELTTRTEPENERLRYGLIKSQKEVKEENTIKFKVQTRYSKDLLEGEERLVQEGKDGLDIRYYDVTTYIKHPETGSLRSPLKEEIRDKREYTAPEPNIIEIGSKDPIKNIEEYIDERIIKHQTIYIDTDELYVGQEEVIREGKDGKEITKYQEITFVDGTTKRHEIGVEVVPAIDKTIKRGTKAPVISEDTETVEEIIPYETAVIKTNDLEPGIREVKREGIDGVAIRTYKVRKMWDGKVERELINEERTEAVFAIILLGTSKKIISQSEVPEITEIPYETERVQTDELYIGQTKVKRPGKNGSTRLTYVKTEFEDGTVERVLIARRTVAATNEIILVGTRRRQADDSIKNIKPMNDKMSGNWLYLEDGDHTIRTTVKSTFRPKWGYL